MLANGDEFLQTAAFHVLNCDNEVERNTTTTIELKPEQSHVIDQAIAAGLIERADEVVKVGVDALRDRLDCRESSPELKRSQIAGERIRELRKGVTLSGITIKELIEEGRE